MVGFHVSPIQGFCVTDSRFTKSDTRSSSCDEKLAGGIEPVFVASINLHPILKTDTASCILLGDQNSQVD